MLEEEFQGAIGEECGVVAICGHPEASNIAYLALHALQHRGQESVGMASRAAGDLIVTRKMGRVAEVIQPADLATLRGETAIGHVRYSTTGESSIRNAQPIAVDVKYGPVAIAHNGNLTNAARLRRDLEARGSIFHSTSDTEVLAHLIARSSRATLREALIEAVRQVEGAWSMIVLARDELFAMRDPHGVRPLSLGILDGAHLVVSETTALDLVRARFVRDLEPGEFLSIDPSGQITSARPLPEAPRAACIFELVYFARPDSTVFGRSVYDARVRMGAVLARASAVDADLVVPVPDSGVPAALGFSRHSGLPFELGLIRSHYVGRTFIEPGSSIRHFGVKLKLNPVPHLIRDRRIVVVDDSIVRGTTCRKIVALLREAGAREVHFRVASPPTRWPCFYGIDTPVRKELIAASHTVAETASYIGADTLAYLSLDGLHEACSAAASDSEAPRGYCDACFSGRYPIRPEAPAEEWSAP